MKKNITIVFLFAFAFCFSQNFDRRYRWDIKTLADSDAVKINFDSINPITIDSVNNIINAYQNKNIKFRTYYEKFVYSITCEIVGYKSEADEDVHLWMKDLNSNGTMVAEIPDTSLMKMKRVEVENARRQFMMGAKEKIEDLGKYEITGILFFDKLHGQRGGAKNGAEIHPVLSIKKMN